MIFLSVLCGGVVGIVGGAILGAQLAYRDVGYGSESAFRFLHGLNRR